MKEIRIGNLTVLQSDTQPILSERVAIHLERKKWAWMLEYCAFISVYEAEKHYANEIGTRCDFLCQYSRLKTSNCTSCPVYRRLGMSCIESGHYSWFTSVRFSPMPDLINSL